MFKTSIATRVMSFAILLSLVFASFPTATGVAKTNTPGLERKWAKLVDLYRRQAQVHNSAPRWVEWMMNNAKVSNAKKANLQRALTASNSAWGPVPSIAMRHSGFDSSGNVVDKAAAQQSIRDLSRALQRYNASVKRLKSLLRQFNLKV